MSWATRTISAAAMTEAWGLRRAPLSNHQTITRMWMPSLTRPMGYNRNQGISRYGIKRTKRQPSPLHLPCHSARTLHTIPPEESLAHTVWPMATVKQMHQGIIIAALLQSGLIRGQLWPRAKLKPHRTYHKLRPRSAAAAGRAVSTAAAKMPPKAGRQRLPNPPGQRIQVPRRYSSCGARWHRGARCLRLRSCRRRRVQAL